MFWDDNIAADPRYAKALFRAITPCKKWWTAQATIKIAEDEELLRLAAESGCKAFFLGLESFSQASLDGTNKSFNQAKDYRELVAKLHGYGIAVQAGIMLGFDQDGPDVFERTLEAAGKIGIDNATISLVIPFPGTRLFERLEREGRILTRDWARYNGKTDVVFRPKLMTPDVLQAGFEWVAARVLLLGLDLAAARTLAYGPGMERAAQCGLSSGGLSAWRSRLQSGRGSLRSAGDCLGGRLIDGRYTRSPGLRAVIRALQIWLTTSGEQTASTNSGGKLVEDAISSIMPRTEATS